jgi:uncharacterized coiled-coil protein SlyX
MEWLKELLDALNADHYEADASEALEKSGLQRLRDRGREIACVTFFDSLVLVQKLPREKRTPYRRIMTGRDARVINLADQVVSAMPASQMRALLMPLSTVEAFAPTLLTAMAELKTKLSQSNHLREQAEAAARHLNSAREQNVQELRAQVAERDQSVHDLRALVATREQNVRDLQTRIAASEQNVRDLNAQVAERDQNVCELQAQIAQRDQNIRNLQAQLYHLQTRSAFPKFEDLSSL